MTLLECSSADALIRAVAALVRVTPSFVKNNLAKLTQGSTTVTGSLTIATQLLKESEYKHLLGLSPIEEAQVYQFASWALYSPLARKELNDTLALKTFIVNNRFSMADIALYSSLYSTSFLPNDRLEWPHVIRYFNLIQNVCKEMAPDSGLEIITFDLTYPQVEAKNGSKSTSKPGSKKDKGKDPIDANPKVEKIDASKEKTKKKEAGLFLDKNSP